MTNLKDIHHAILGILQQAKTPLSAYDLLAKINKKSAAKPYAPPQAYRALKYLTEKHLAHRLESQNAYIACQHDHADHGDHRCTHDEAVQFLVCSQCDKTAEIEIPAVLKAMNRAAADTGFTITQPVIELMGLCGACNALPQPAAARTARAKR